MCSEAKPKYCNPPFFWFLETFHLISFLIFLRMESLQLLWSSWHRVKPPSWFIFFFPHIQHSLTSAACIQFLSKPGNLRIIWFNSLMGDSGEDEGRRYYPWLFPLQAEQKPLLAYPGTHSSWWFTSEVPPVNQHLSYTGKSQTGHYPPDVV